jgi:hypothetical protein
MTRLRTLAAGSGPAMMVIDPVPLLSGTGSRWNSHSPATYPATTLGPAGTAYLATYLATLAGPPRIQDRR